MDIGGIGDTLTEYFSGFNIHIGPFARGFFSWLEDMCDFDNDGLC